MGQWANFGPPEGHVPPPMPEVDDPAAEIVIRFMKRKDGKVTDEPIVGIDGQPLPPMVLRNDSKCRSLKFGRLPLCLVVADKRMLFAQRKRGKGKIIEELMNLHGMQAKIHQSANSIVRSTISWALRAKVFGEAVVEEAAQEPPQQQPPAVD